MCVGLRCGVCVLNVVSYVFVCVRVCVCVCSCVFVCSCACVNVSECATIKVLLHASVSNDNYLPDESSSPCYPIMPNIKYAERRCAILS
jgi:hypothetical protein